MSENDRTAVAQAVIDEIDPIGPADDLNLPIKDPERFLLVERNLGGASGSQSHWFTTHISPAKAGEYNTSQEYAEEWTIEVLVDLDTGERFEADYGVTFHPVATA